MQKTVGGPVRSGQVTHVYTGQIQKSSNVTIFFMLHIKFTLVNYFNKSKSGGNNWVSRVKPIRKGLKIALVSPSLWSKRSPIFIEGNERITLLLTLFIISVKHILMVSTASFKLSKM